MDPIRIPLSTFQQARFAAIAAEMRAITLRRAEACATVVAHDHDIDAMATWSMDLLPNEIVLTPPAVPPEG